MGIKNRAFVGIAGAAMGLTAPAAVLADHKPGHAPGQQQGGNLTITAVQPTITWGQATTVSGTLKGNNNAGQRVEIQALPHPFTGQWTTVDSMLTDAKGDYTDIRKPKRLTRFRAVVGSTISPEVTVQVRIRVPRRVSDPTPSRGERVRFFSDGVAPAHDGATVRLQKRSPSGSWVTVRRTVLRDTDNARFSRYSVRTRVRRDGTYRVRVSGDADHLRGTSRPRSLDVGG